MPKVKKIRSSALKSQEVRHEPLGQVIQKHSTSHAVASQRTKTAPTETDSDVPLLDEKSSHRILSLSKIQQLELQAEDAAAEKRRRPMVDSDEEDEEVELNDDYVMANEEYVAVDEAALGLTAEDEILVNSMMRNSTEERRTLADMILEKIEEKEAVQRGEQIEYDEDELQLPPKVVQVYTEIGKLLSRYTSGKLPKAFKVIPSLSNWEDILLLTRPDQWTPQAMFAATKIFASNLHPAHAQRFYSLVLLDSVRADIYHNKKLNYHYYMALKKSVYKPAAFFKGILLPLTESSDCTLREAAIVASVLARVSIPVHHAAVAIHKLTLIQDYNPATSIFLKVLLNKKYSLPSPVIGSCVRHFAGFVSFEGKLPVLWHQALLVFCQRYKVQDEAREALRKVLKKHCHLKITPEVRRELFGAQAYQEERQGMEL